MENDVICAKFILELHNDGYYVDNCTLNAAKTILNDYAEENDCEFYTDDYDEL